LGEIFEEWACEEEGEVREWRHGDGNTIQQERQEGLWIATADLPRSGGHPFDERLNELLAEAV